LALRLDPTAAILMTNPHKGYLFPFACFACRRSFKRRYEPGVSERPCPRCGGNASRLDRKFRPPAGDDLKQWEKVRFLYEHGFRFQSVCDEQGSPVSYPATLAEAEPFVRRFGNQSTRPSDASGASGG
jgi:hypothetical protein